VEGERGKKNAGQGNQIPVGFFHGAGFLIRIAKVYT
jgi:hypothetical protein